MNNKKAALIAFISITAILFITIITTVSISVYNKYTVNKKGNIERLTRINAENIKNKADESLKNNDTNKATEYYIKAIDEYKKINDIDEIHSIRLILKNIDSPGEKVIHGPVEVIILSTN